MKTILTRIRGVLGVPLVYVIRHQLIPKDEDDDPSFGDDDTIVGKSKYTSHDHEAITRCPILTEDCDPSYVLRVASVALSPIRSATIL